MKKVELLTNKIELRVLIPYSEEIISALTGLDVLLCSFWGLQFNPVDAKTKIKSA